MAKTPAAAKAAPAAEEQLPATQEAGGALAPVGTAMPDWAKEYQGPLGTENIDTQDVNIPRLKLGQSMTPEVKDKLVNDGDMFHSITKEVIIALGSSGIVVPVAYQKEYILWRDRNDGGGIFARAKRVVMQDGAVRYAWDKPNSTFQTKIKGVQKVEWRTKQFIDEDGLDQFGTMIKGDAESPPAATAHFNYVMYLPERGDMVALSFARSAAKKAKDMNAMLKMGSAPMFMRCFRLNAVPDQNEAGDKFYNYGVVPAGFIQDKTTFDNLQRIYMELRDKGVNVDFSDEPDASGNSAKQADQENF
jgi:hypothetical protein